MNDIKKYTTPSGKIRYGFTIYTGKDETTGNSIEIRKRGFKTKIEALKEYDSIQDKMKRGLYNPLQNSRYRLRDFFEIWFANYKQTVKPATASTVKRLFKIHILKSLGNIYLDKLSIVICQKTINEWSKSQGKELFRLETLYLNNMLKYATLINLIPFNPMTKVIKPKISNKKRKTFTNFYSKQELNIFLQSCKKLNRPKLYTLFRVLAYSGMRIGELLALQWSDIDFNNNTIDINKTVSMVNSKATIDTPKTKNSYRTLSMDAETMTILKRWQFQQRQDLFKLGFNPFNKDQLVFTNENNNLILEATVSRWNALICERFNLRHIKIHGFRHTHASLLFQAHTPMKDVQERLGHGSITTTMNIYTHVTPKQSQKAINNFANFMQS